MHDFQFPSIAIPSYFREVGIFKSPNNLVFVFWCFERLSPETRITYEKSIKIELKQNQFIFTRVKCVEETGLTENEVRTQQERWEKWGFLKKIPNNAPNKFTIYEWDMSHILDYETKKNYEELLHV